MRELPPILRPWSKELRELAPALHGAMTPLVQRLDALVGPLQGVWDAGATEPHGYGGLGRRGSYERLLLSEWALAEELPEEFLRRAAGGEHLFYELDRRSPDAGRRCVLVLDAGPEQLGSPRLAHLAALVVLARRADRAGVSLQWVVAQEEPAPERVSDEVSPASVARLLVARTGRPAEEGRLAAWLALLEVGPADELWLLGGPGLCALGPASARRVTIAESVGSGPEVLTVRLLEPSGSAREVELPLPSTALRTAALRRPFEPLRSRAEAPPRRGDGSRALQAPFHFGSGGLRLLGLDGRGDALAWRLPSGKRGGTGPPKVRWRRPAETFVALGWGRQRLLALARRGAELVLYGVATDALPVPRPPGGPIPFVVGRPEPLVLNVEQGLDGVLFRDAQGALWGWTIGSERPPDRLLDGGCEALATREGRSLWMARGPQGGGWRLGPTSQGISDLVEDVLPPGEGAFIGPTGRPHPMGLMAYALPEGGWTVVARVGAAAGEVLETFLPEPGERVLGCTVAGSRTGKAALLVLSEDHTQLEVLQADGQRVKLPVEEPVVEAACSPDHPLVAWMDEAGTLLAWDVLARRLALRLDKAKAEAMR